MRLKPYLLLLLAEKFEAILHKKSESQTGHRIIKWRKGPGFQKKYRIVGWFIMSLFLTSHGQPVIYVDFEGNKLLYYGERSGILDTAFKNPLPNVVNNSATCALYIRNSTRKFDNLKMKLQGNPADVSVYATYLGEPPKLRLKIKTDAPAGTLVEILLGSQRGNNDYPAGTHSQYQAYTTISNNWEQLEFKFSQIPQGSETPANQVDQITLLFNPNSSTSHTYCFDDLMGPALSKTVEPVLEPEKITEKPKEAKKGKTKNNKK